MVGFGDNGGPSLKRLARLLTSCQTPGSLFFGEVEGSAPPSRHGGNDALRLIDDDFVPEIAVVMDTELRVGEGRQTGHVFR
jgi:hypothetical protein